MSKESFTTLTTSDATSIYVRSWMGEGAKHILLCIQGLGGHGGYYDVLGDALCAQGTIVVAPDLRGHGQSQGRRGDIGGFGAYLQDIDCVVAWIREQWVELPIFLLGESMGSSIAIGYLTHPKPLEVEIAGLALVSPLLRPIVHPSIQEVRRGVRAFFTPTRPLMAVTGREDLGCREQAFNDRLRSDPLFIRYVSIRFLLSVSNWLKQMQKRAKNITLPLLVLRGERDYVAHPAGTEQFLKEVGSLDVESRTFQGAYHCLFHDPVTPEILQMLQHWLDIHTSD
jgi:alpha-beta hydrolase superfamily lysophospholipase